MLFLLPFIAFAGICSASTCASSTKVSNMNCIDYITPNGTQAAIHIHTNTTATPNQQQGQPGPGKQLQMANFYPGSPGQAPITECGKGLYEDSDAYADTAATGADCYAIWDWAQSNAGFWTLSPDNLRADPWTVFVMTGNCAVLMKTLDGELPNWPIYVGDEDVATVLNVTLSRFMEPNGMLQATGVFDCPTSDGKGGEDKVPTTWWVRTSLGIITE
ncbi:hypothetical protein PG988_003670 [Apiospora saccharicola]